MGNGASTSQPAPAPVAPAPTPITKPSLPAKTTGGKPVISAPPLAAQQRQQIYENRAPVVNLQDPAFSKNWLGSYAVKPTLPNNPSLVPGAFSPDNQSYGVNKQWETAPVVPGTSLFERLTTAPIKIATGALNPNPIKNPLVNPLAFFDMF